MKMMMNNYTTVKDAIDALNSMTDEMGPFGLVMMGEDEEAEGMNVETPIEMEIGETGEMATEMGEYYPEEEEYD